MTADTLRKARKERGLTVREVGKLLYASAQTISYSENPNLERKMVSDQMIGVIADLYGLDSKQIVEEYKQERIALKKR